jgi:hypothetical protein
MRVCLSGLCAGTFQRMNDSGRWGSSWRTRRDGGWGTKEAQVSLSRGAYWWGVQGCFNAPFCPQWKPPLQISYCNRPWYSVACACAQPRPAHFPFLLSALTSFGTVTLNSHIMQTASLPLTVLRGFEMAQLSNKGQFMQTGLQDAWVLAVRPEQ